MRRSPESDRTVGVVGGGVAGLGAAYALRNADVDVHVFEETAAVGGRVATGERAGCLFDAGANYVKPTGGPTDAVIRDLGEAGLVDVEAPVYAFDDAGEIDPGERRDEHKWTYESGLVELPRRLATRSGAEIHHGTTVTGVVRGHDGWQLYAGDGETAGPFDAVVLAAPAPATAELLPRDDRFAPLRERLRDVPFRSIRSLVLHYPFEIDRPYYGLIDVTKEHPVGWVGRERAKRGHVPDGEEVIVVQMGPNWTEDHRDRPTETAAMEAATRLADLLGEDRLADPDWAEDYRWRPALPDGGVPDDLLGSTADDGLYFAGDWVEGKGRVGLALESGIEVGESIADV